MEDAIQRMLMADPRVGYALVFGSHAAGRSTAFSDLDIAIGARTGTTLERRAIGELTSRLERAAGRTVDLVVLDEASPALAYRIFRDGRLLFEVDHAALVRHQTLTVLKYLDFKPAEQLCARAVIEAAAHG